MGTGKSRVRDAGRILAICAILWGPEILARLVGGGLPPVVVGLAVFLSLPAAAIGAVVVAGRTGGLQEIGLRRIGSWRRSLGAGLAMGTGMLLAARFLINPVVVAAFGPLLDPALLDPLRGDVARLAVNVVVVSWLSAALCEEIVFRGFLLRWFERIMGCVAPAVPMAILLQAVGFGLAHLGRGTSVFVATTLGGLLWGALYVAGGRDLVRLIIAHGLFDTTLFVLAFLGWHRLFLPG